MSQKTLLFALVIALVASSCQRSATQPPTAPADHGNKVGESSAPSPTATTSEPIEPWRRELLELAFDAVSQLPTVPQLKTRCELQTEVALTAIAMGQWDMGRSFARKIDNWERGVVYGTLAMELCRSGLGANQDVMLLIEEAQRAAQDAMSGDDAQEWRRDRIRSLLASAELHRGNTEAAARWSAALEPSERAVFVREQARKAPDDAAMLLRIDAGLATERFEDVAGSIQGALAAYERLAADPTARQPFADRLLSVQRGVARKLAIERLLEFAAVAHRAGDLEHGQLAESRAADLLKGALFELEPEWELRALRAAAMVARGDTPGARALMTDTHTRTIAERTTLPDIFRADLWRSVARGWIKVGDGTMAAEAIDFALEDGALNPNSRPRAEDLSKTLQLLVRENLRPSDAQRERMRQLRANLGEPW